MQRKLKNDWAIESAVGALALYRKGTVVEVERADIGDSWDIVFPKHLYFPHGHRSVGLSWGEIIDVCT